MAAGVGEADAEITSSALVSADLHGIDSHGVAHLSRYVHGLENGSISAQPNFQVVNETPSTALVDGDRGLGFVVAHRSMTLAIEKAKTAGSGIVVARRSTHYGAAGHWAAMALDHGLIGFTMTNASPRVAPRFGSRGMLGTNPIALAVPANQEPPFVLDMATSVVPIGRLEVYARKDKQLPAGWVIDSTGQMMTDAAKARQMVDTWDAEVLPLGGKGALNSGYKGYGLALGVEILSSLLAGYAGAAEVVEGQESEIGQLFGAISIDTFRPLTEFTLALDHRLQDLKSTPPLPGEDRVMVAGQREFEAMQERLLHGIPLHERVLEELKQVGNQYDIEFGKEV